MSIWSSWLLLCQTVDSTESIRTNHGHTTMQLIRKLNADNSYICLEVLVVIFLWLDKNILLVKIQGSS